MVNVQVKCPHCGKSLMNSSRQIDGVPSIEVKLTYAGKNAPVYMSSRYGSYSIETELQMPQGKTAGFRCPHCGADLKVTRKCDVCGSKMVSLELKGGGQVHICSRRGCKKHVLEFQDPDVELDAFYRSYLKTIK